MNKIIAHRGRHNNIIKENTYLAISFALNSNNIAGVEFDVRLTKDKKIVVIHDSSIDRTANGKGIVEEMSLNDLKKYNFGSKEFYQTIPTLDKILDINSNKVFLIEVKINNNEYEFAKVLSKELTIYKDKNLYVASFNKKFLHLFMRLSNIKAGPYIFNNNISNSKYSFFILNYLTFKQKTILKLKNTGKDIFIWGLFNNNIDDIDGLYLIKNIK